MEFTKWWELLRQIEFQSAPPCLVSDDLDPASSRGMVYGGRVADHARFSIKAAPYIPGQAAVWHEFEHDMQFEISERTANVDAWIAELFATRQAPIPTAPDAGTKDAHALMVEQACSMLPEAFLGQWGGYKHPLYDNINDPAGAAQKVTDYFNSPLADTVRWFIRNYKNWQPQPVVVPPPVVVTPPPTAANRLMYDSVTAVDIPPGSDLVAGYIDGANSKWSDADWQRFPGRILVPELFVSLGNRISDKRR